ncbi:MAG: DUF5979 domain-containing protein, partial [Eubacteriales bacterium]|nr:DUF5979 domain-containing protein [Eubacteriales bacterium]
SGNAADSSKAFDFTVTLGDKTVSGTYGDMSFTNGVATLTLKGGESKTATALPAGTSYTAAEADYSADGYVTTKSGDTGTITDGQTATAAFTNTKNTTTPPTPPDEPTPPKTGDNSNLALWIMFLAVSGAALTGTAIYSRKRKHN